MLKEIIKEIVEAFRAHRERSKARRELYAMSDRELADIGIARGDINHLV